MATTTIERRTFETTHREFEDTRPSLYFSQHTWAHLNAVRRLSRSEAANDDQRPEAAAPAKVLPAATPEAPIRDYTTAAWFDDDEDDAAPALVPPLTVPDVQGLELANLAGVAVVAVAALAAAGFLVG